MTSEIGCTLYSGGQVDTIGSPPSSPGNNGVPMISKSGISYAPVINLKKGNEIHSHKETFLGIDI